MQALRAASADVCVSRWVHGPRSTVRSQKPHPRDPQFTQLVESLGDIASRTLLESEEPLRTKECSLYPCRSYPQVRRGSFIQVVSANAKMTTKQTQGTTIAVLMELASEIRPISAVSAAPPTMAITSKDEPLLV